MRKYKIPEFPETPETPEFPEFRLGVKHSEIPEIPEFNPDFFQNFTTKPHRYEIGMNYLNKLVDLF